MRFNRLAGYRHLRAFARATQRDFTAYAPAGSGNENGLAA